MSKPDLLTVAKRALDWFEQYQLERQQRHREFIADFRKRHPEYEDEPDDLPELPITIALREAIAGQDEEKTKEAPG